MIVLFAAVEGVSIAALVVTALTSASDPTILAVPGWNSSTSNAVNAFTDYFGSASQPAWEAMAQAQQPPKPWTNTLSTSIDSISRAPVQLFGPNATLYDACCCTCCCTCVSIHVHAHAQEHQYRAADARNVFAASFASRVPTTLSILNGLTEFLAQPSNMSDSLFAFVSSHVRGGACLAYVE